MDPLCEETFKGPTESWTQLDSVVFVASKLADEVQDYYMDREEFEITRSFSVPWEWYLYTQMDYYVNFLRVSGFEAHNPENVFDVTSLGGMRGNDVIQTSENSSDGRETFPSWARFELVLPGEEWCHLNGFKRWWSNYCPDRGLRKRTTLTRN